MTDEPTKKDVNLGMFNQPRPSTVLPGDLIAAALSILWVLICGVFFLFARRPDSTVSFDSLNFVMTVLAVLLPIALIWVAAVAARSVAVVREESHRLQNALDVLRQNYVDLAQSRRLQVTPPVTAAVPVPAAPVKAPEVIEEPEIEDECSESKRMQSGVETLQSKRNM